MSSTGVLLARLTRMLPFAYSIPRSLQNIALLSLVLLAGCATTIPPNAGKDPRDPYEVFNRHVFAMNQNIDEGFLKPLAETWQIVLPSEIRDCLGNAFFNLRGPSTVINDLLQGKPADSLSDAGRFLINTTIGLLGCIDVASKMGLEIHREDFGQTLGVWGFGPGPYLVVPVFGPSSGRDFIGIYGVEPFLDLNFYIRYAPLEYSVFALRIVNERAELLSADRLVSQIALDRYTFIRDAYLQRRRSLVYDGNPPPQSDQDLEPDDAIDAPAGPKPADPKPTEPKPTEPKPPPSAPPAASDVNPKTSIP